ADQHQQPAAGVGIFLVRLEVIREAVDPLREERDLHFGGAGIAFVGLELLDEALLALDGQSHARILPGFPPNRHVPRVPTATPSRDGFRKWFSMSMNAEASVTRSVGTVKLTRL